MVSAFAYILEKIVDKAILVVSSLSLVASLGTLAIMAKTAQRLDQASKKVATDVETFKQKTDRNLARVKSVLSQMEF